MPFDGSSGETAPPLPFRRSRCGYSERASRECASTRRSSGLGLNSSSRQVPRHSNTLRYSTTSTPGRRSRGCRDSAQPRWSRGPAAAISRNGELDPRYKKILDQLNKQQQRARSRHARGRLAAEPRASRERLRDHQGYTLPQIVVVQEAAPIRRVGGL